MPITKPKGRADNYPTRDELDCPAYDFSAPRSVDGSPLTILDYAAHAARAAAQYRAAIDAGAEYRTMLRVSGFLARATAELCSAIADSVATGDGSLTS